MKQLKPIALPIYVIGSVIIFRICLLILVLTDLGNYSSGDSEIPDSFLLWPILLIVEYIIYWNIRNRIYNKKWMHIHVLIVFLCLGLIPCAELVYRTFDPIIVMTANSPYSTFLKMQVYGFWIMIGIGHVFFIGTIVKSFSSKKETIEDEQAPGLLNEFAD